MNIRSSEMDRLDAALDHLTLVLSSDYIVTTYTNSPRITATIDRSVQLSSFGNEKLVKPDDRNTHTDIMNNLTEQRVVLRDIVAWATRNGLSGSIMEHVRITGNEEDLWSSENLQLEYRLILILVDNNQVPNATSITSQLLFSAETTTIYRDIPTISGDAGYDLRMLIEREWLPELAIYNYRGTVQQTKTGYSLLYTIILRVILLHGKRSLTARITRITDEINGVYKSIRERMSQLPQEINRREPATMGKVDRRSVPVVQILPSLQQTIVDGLTQYALYYYLRVSMKLKFWPSEYLVV